MLSFPEVLAGVRAARSVAGTNEHAAMFLARLAARGLVVVDGAALETLAQGRSAAVELAKAGALALSERGR